MKAYLSFAQSSFMIGITYRVGFFFALVGNLAYIALVYFLWQRIYDGQETMHGMTFNQTFVYLTLASSLFVLFKTWTDWEISRAILQGSIVSYMLKPLDYQWVNLANSAGFALFNAILITIPSLLVILVLFHSSIVFGLNVLFFIVSVMLAFTISFALDYIVGLTSFYTTSLWGLSMTKEVIVSMLSGLLIPIQFFPEGVQKVLAYLPFQAIYHTPLELVTNNALTLADAVRLVGIQLLWVVLLLGAGRLFFRQASKVLTINGG